MIRLGCHCGAEISFDDRQCPRCQKRLGFDPTDFCFYPIDQDGFVEGGGSSMDGRALCSNGQDYDACNWIRPAASQTSLCYGCEFNRYIPNLSRGHNLSLWRTLENNKKRLLFSLMGLGLPLSTRWECPDSGLFFDFLEDLHEEGNNEGSPITTGYLDGVITINVLEAEPISRIRQQEAAREVYRTVLGHMRHESGHYFYQHLTQDQGFQGQYEPIFGIASADYSEALNRYYRDGAAENWSESFISPYASAHPLEDWAETWGHYLHMYDTLETASNFFEHCTNPDRLSFDDKICAWGDLSTALNEMNRSLGMSDPYPFAINERVKDKLRFVNDSILALKTRKKSWAVDPPPS